MKFSNCKLKPLCLISELVGLSVPNILNYSGLPVLYLIYVLLLLSSLLFTSVQTLKYKILYEYENFLSTVIVLDFGFNLLLLLCNVLSLIQATFVKRRNYVSFFKKLNEFDNYFHKDFGAIQCRARFFYFEFVLTHLLCIAYLIYGNYYITTNEINEFVYYYCCHFTINIYLITITVLQIYYYVATVNERLYNVNVKSRYYINQYKLMKKFAKNLKGRKFVENVDFSAYLKSHDNLCDLFDLLSSGFGWQIFFVLLISAVSFLRSTNVCLKYLFGTFRMEEGFAFAFFATTSIIFAVRKLHVMSLEIMRILFADIHRVNFDKLR